MVPRHCQSASTARFVKRVSEVLKHLVHLAAPCGCAFGCPWLSRELTRHLARVWITRFNAEAHGLVGCATAV